MCAYTQFNRVLNANVTAAATQINAKTLGRFAPCERSRGRRP